MDLAQATGVIMGANIGTTITSILIAMDISALAPLCIAIGALMLLYAKRKRTKYIGQVILGFGLLFQGLKTMSSAMSPLKDSPVFQKFIMNATNPILGFVVGVLLCAILQSSSASVGILQALAMQGLMPLRFAAFLVCGINVGSSTPPLLSALNAKNNAKRAAFIYLIYNLVGAVIFMPIVMITPLTNLLENTIAAPALQVSAFHILFKVVTALVLLPLTNQVVKLTYSFIPKQAHESAFRLEYIDKNLVGNPNVTILQVSKEIGRMVDLIRDSFKTAIDGLATGDLSADGKIRDNEEVLDFLTGEISSYLMQANNRRLPYNVAHYMGSCFQAINDLEQIGDHCVKFWVQNEKNVDAKISYSEQAINELIHIADECSRLLDEVMPHFLDRTLTEDMYRDIRSKETDIVRDANIAEAGHMKRVHEGECTFEQGLTFIEAINSINRIANHLSSIAEVGHDEDSRLLAESTMSGYLV
jgi:phosphate:Na+ symporter